MIKLKHLLQTLWAEPRPPLPQRRRRVELGVVLALAGVALLEAVYRPGVEWRVYSLLITWGMLPMLILRRERPLLAVFVAFGLSTVMHLPALLAGVRLDGLNTMAFMLMLPFALLRWGTGRELLLGIPFIYGCAVLGTAFSGAPAGDYVGAFAVLSLSMAIGVALRYRERAQLRALKEAALTERGRIARDLHDTVAHHMSAIAIQAQAGLATMAQQPGRAAEALRAIEKEASRALAEMRWIVRVLREDESAELAPGPRIADIAHLAEVPGAGPMVEVTLSGPVNEVPSAPAAVVYRLAQEAVTNARRHAREATRIDVRVEVDADALRLCVADDGLPNPAGGKTSTGFGLAGMMERVELLGGTCQAGPSDGRGWVVTAKLPRMEFNR